MIGLVRGVASLEGKEVLWMNSRTLLGGGGGATVATSPVVLVGDIAVGVMLPTIARAVSPAVFAEVVAADAISVADADVVTVGVADLADAGIPFPPDPAGLSP